MLLEIVTVTDILYYNTGIVQTIESKKRYQVISQNFEKAAD